MKKFASYLLGYVIYPFSFLVPRNRKKMVFGCPRNRFDGNPKYLFVEYARRGLDVCWISGDKATVNNLKAKGLPAEYLFSAKGAWRALRSGWWLVGAYSSDILFFLSGGAKVFNLWHGVGLKLCEFNITSGPLARRYVDKTLKERFYHPEVFRRPDLMLTASPFQTNMFAPAFRIRKEQCIESGYPRNGILLWDEATRRSFIDKYEEPWVSGLISELGQFRKVCVYMPTWRDSGASAMQAIDFKALNQVLESQGDALVVKDHFNNRDGGAFREGNIFHLHPASDIYPVLPYTHCLITDYSSVLYDYILMPGKTVVLHLFDYDKYSGERDFFYPFLENVIGEITRNPDELTEVLKRGPRALDETKRQELLLKFWNKHENDYDFDNYLHLQ